MDCMRFVKGNNKCFHAVVGLLFLLPVNVKADPVQLPGLSIVDSSGTIVGVIDSCPSNNFGCIVRTPVPGGRWVRLGASGQGIFSVYDVPGTGIYYGSTGCTGQAYIAPVNTLIPEAPLLNVTNTGSTIAANLLYPSGIYGSYSYNSYTRDASGLSCATATGKITGFPASTLPITFTGPLAIKSLKRDN